MGYLHEGLSATERKIVEQLFNSGMTSLHRGLLLKKEDSLMVPQRRKLLFLHSKIIEYMNTCKCVIIEGEVLECLYCCSICSVVIFKCISWFSDYRGCSGGCGLSLALLGYQYFSTPCHCHGHPVLQWQNTFVRPFLFPCGP